MYMMSKKESYTQNESKVFEEAIADWCTDFVKFLYYIAVAAICKYRVLNALLTETYKMLHKYYVKNPYHLSNRKDVMRQLVNALKGLAKILWELTLDIIDQKIKSLKKCENPLHPNFIKGLSQIILTLDTFLDTSSQDSESEEFYIKVYDAVYLNNGQILRTTGEFHGKEWFSNIAVTPVENQEQYNSDEGAWYGKILLIFKFFQGSFKEPYELAFIRWYNINLTVPELYGCPQLYFTKEYNTIPIG
ncbi:hypothetical protein RhiirC2_800045 [Rhizophagus irregularis]|uniref:Uncharacterized protein n=1 Tax=Rhizophagus irregularis TaxID=588596 RepID=A0A2N1M450_9GLOM|nr:hypothetical protein RhiirC2_800045 [Rhizophagus irregularis]